MCVCVCDQSCLTLCDAVGCGPPGSIHGILQARRQEIVPPPRVLPKPVVKPASPAFPALQADSFPLSHLGESYCRILHCLLYFFHQQLSFPALLPMMNLICLHIFAVCFIVISLLSGLSAFNSVLLLGGLCIACLCST